nr:Glycoprotein CDS [Astacus astacus]
MHCVFLITVLMVGSGVGGLRLTPEEISGYKDLWSYKPGGGSLPSCSTSKQEEGKIILDTRLSCISSYAKEPTKGNAMYSCQFGGVDVIPDSHDYCFIGSYNNNKDPLCIVSPMLVPWVFDQSKIVISPSLKLHFRADPKILDDYNCQISTNDTKIECVCTSGCRGDDKFTENFPTNPEAPCFCSFNGLKGSMMVDVDGELYRPQCWGITRTFVGVKVDKKHSTHCPFCDADCLKEGVHIKTYGPRLKVVTICKSSMCLTTSTSSQDIRVSLPSEMLLIDDSTIVELWMDKSPESLKVTLSCPVMGECDLIRCLLCWDYALSVKCWSWIMAPFIVILLLISLSILAGVNKGLKLVLLVLKPIYWFVWKIMKWVYYKILKRIRYQKLQINMDVAIEEGQIRMDPTPLYCCLVFFALIIPSYQCSVSQTLSVSNSECFNLGNGLKECKISQKLRLAVSPVGQESCFSLLDDNSRALGSLVVKTSTVEVTCIESSQYFVPSVVMNCLSEKHCSGSGQCVNGCKDEKSLDNWKSQSEKMHKFRCITSCGCAGCGCFYCTPGCLYAMAFLESRNHHEVLTCSEWQFNVKIEVRLNTGGKSLSRDLILRPGQPRRAFNSTFGLISISPTISDLANKCFLRDMYEDISLVECNKRGEYSGGRIGEIQCPNEESAKGGLSSCFFDETMIEITDRGLAADCIGHFISTDDLFHNNRLPKHYPGILIRKSINGSIVADFSSSSLLEIQIDTQGLTMVQTIDRSTCFAEFISLTGCYSCDSGAKLRMRIKTDIGETVGHLNCPTIGVHIAMPVTAELVIRNATLASGVQSIKTDCTFDCPGSSQPISIQGALIYVANKIFSNTTMVHSAANLKSSAPDVWSFLSLDSLYMALGVIALLIVVGVIVKVARGYRRRNHEKIP